jgi:hypothetical protein
VTAVAPSLADKGGEMTTENLIALKSVVSQREGVPWAYLRADHDRWNQ